MQPSGASYELSIFGDIFHAIGLIGLAFTSLFAIAVFVFDMPVVYGSKHAAPRPITTGELIGIIGIFYVAGLFFLTLGRYLRGRGNK